MKYGFIGCGNMGGALARAAGKVVKPGEMYVCDADVSKAEMVASLINAKHLASVGEQSLTDKLPVLRCEADKLAAECDYIFLCVKPQGMEELFEQIRPVLKERSRAGEHFILVSIAAGLTMNNIRAMAGAIYPIIRLMPNLPASCGEGMILAVRDDVTDEEMGTFKTLMAAAGKMVELESEELIDPAGAISGCGPAFFAQFVAAFGKAGAALGVDEKLAQALAAQTMLGTAKFLQTGALGDEIFDPNKFVDMVCSPGGTTIEGVKVFREGDMDGVTAKAVKAANDKSKKLAKK